MYNNNNNHTSSKIRYSSVCGWRGGIHDEKRARAIAGSTQKPGKYYCNIFAENEKIFIEFCRKNDFFSLHFYIRNDAEICFFRRITLVFTKIKRENVFHVKSTLLIPIETLLYIGIVCFSDRSLCHTTARQNPPAMGRRMKTSWIYQRK